MLKADLTQLSTMISDDAPLKISSKDAPNNNSGSFTGRSEKQRKDKELSDTSNLEIMTSRSNQPYPSKLDRTASLFNTSSKETEKSFSLLPHESPSTTSHPNLQHLNLARPAAPRQVHQPDTKCMVKVSN